jgi:hypothetical protein
MAVLRLRRTTRLPAERPTLVLGAAALVTTAAVVGTEIWRVARARAEEPAALPADPVVELEETARQTVEVAMAGYREGSTRENALLNLLVSFTLTFGVARLGTTMIRRGNGRWGPFRNVVIGRSHVHHFVPGIIMAFLAGGVSVLSRNEELDPYLAVPFGAGVALTLDESALLLKLDDVYWTEEGIVSVQVTLAAMLMLSTLAVVLRVLRRGERIVLDGEDEDGVAAA